MLRNGTIADLLFIQKGNQSVLINNKPIARQDDKTNHSLRSFNVCQLQLNENLRVGTRERDASRAERDVDEQIGEYASASTLKGD